MTGKRDFTAGPDDEGRRLDRVLRILLGGLPLSAIYKALRKKRILVNGAKADPSRPVATGDLISIDDGLLTPEDTTAGPARTPGRQMDRGAEGLVESMLLFRSADLLILNKPRGIPSHGQGGLDLLVRAQLPPSKEASLAFTPAPLHRLDRNTTGALAFSLSIRGAHAFTEALREGKIRKTYLALVDGLVEGGETWEDLLARDEGTMKSGVSDAGERAVTSIRPLLASRNKSLIVATLETGRTHQVRVQASAHGHPLSGDAKYGGSPLACGYVLHAWRLDFPPSLLPGLPGRVAAPLPHPARAILEAEFGTAALDEALGRD
jgi:23S rRNA pseudouridine955/2504/2580 synthase